jgi:hypothetical protein
VIVPICPYPELHLASLDVVGRSLAGRELPQKSTFHAAWHLVGYAASFWDRHQFPVRGDDALTDEKASEMLLGLREAVESGQDGAPDWFDWRLVMPSLLRLMDRLLVR